MARRSHRSVRSFPRIRNWFVGLNLAVAVVLGSWYALQPANRQQEVGRLVESAFASDKHVSAFDVAWDVWQLYYADSAKGQVAAGDKAIVYGGVPIRTGLAAGIPLRILRNRGYVVGYNDDTGNPAWVAYRMKDIGSLPRPAARPEKFELDRRTAARVSPDDYTGSGYDRGHLAPNYAIATRFGDEAQRETFLMSNITPQLHSLNAGLWKELEFKIATSYPARYEEVWTFAGPIFGDQPKRLRGRVVVPEAFFMIIVDEHEGKLRTLAFIIPQQAPPTASPNGYLTSVSEIQRRTQLNFLPELEDTAEWEVEQQAAGRVW